MKRKSRSVIVTCSDEDDAATKVASRLEKIGFHVDSVLEFAGSVVGEWDDELARLREVPGVVAAEESEEKYPQ